MLKHLKIIALFLIPLRSYSQCYTMPNVEGMQGRYILDDFKKTVSIPHYNKDFIFQKNKPFTFKETGEIHDVCEERCWGLTKAYISVTGVIHRIDNNDIGRANSYLFTSPGTYNYYAMANYYGRECGDEGVSKTKQITHQKITVEDPRWLAEVDKLKKVCNEDDVIQLKDYFNSSIKGVEFTLFPPGPCSSEDCLPHKVISVNPKALNPGKYRISAFKHYDNGSFFENIEMEIHPSVKLKLQAPSEVCINSSVHLKADPDYGEWSGDGVDKEGNFTGSKLGKNKVTYSYTKTHCPKDTTIFIDVLPLPKVSSPPNQSICKNSPPLDLSQLIGHPQGGKFIFRNEEITSFDPQKTNDSRNTLTYKYVNPSGCESSANFTIALTDPPKVKAGEDLALCPASDPFRLTGENPTGGTWAFAENTALVQGSIFNPKELQAGSYTLKYTYKDSKGCEASAERKLTIKPVEPVKFDHKTLSVCGKDNLVALPSADYFIAGCISSAMPYLIIA